MTLSNQAEGKRRSSSIVGQNQAVMRPSFSIVSLGTSTTSGVLPCVMASSRARYLTHAVVRSTQHTQQQQQTHNQHATAGHEDRTWSVRPIRHREFTRRCLMELRASESVSIERAALDSVLLSILKGLHVREVVPESDKDSKPHRLITTVTGPVHWAAERARSPSRVHASTRSPCFPTSQRHNRSDSQSSVRHHDASCCDGG